MLSFLSLREMSVWYIIKFAGEHDMFSLSLLIRTIFGVAIIYCGFPSSCKAANSDMQMIKGFMFIS